MGGIKMLEKEIKEYCESCKAYKGYCTKGCEPGYSKRIMGIFLEEEILICFVKE